MVPNFLLMKIFEYNIINPKQMFMNRTIYNLIQNKLSNIRKIQNFYRNKRIQEDTAFPNTKLDLIRLYISKYPMVYLLQYPETVAYNNPILIRWIHNNLHIDYMKRTRRDIRRFLELDEVTFDDMIAAGW